MKEFFFFFETQLKSLGFSYRNLFNSNALFYCYLQQKKRKSYTRKTSFYKFRVLSEKQIVSKSLTKFFMGLKKPQYVIGDTIKKNG